MSGAENVADNFKGLWAFFIWLEKRDTFLLAGKNNSGQADLELKNPGRIHAEKRDFVDQGE